MPALDGCPSTRGLLCNPHPTATLYLNVRGDLLEDVCKLCSLLKVLTQLAQAYLPHGRIWRAHPEGIPVHSQSGIIHLSALNARQVGCLRIADLVRLTCPSTTTRQVPGISTQLLTQV
jgi:hypothetical protein